MIEVRGLTKQYGAFTAVKNISFRVDKGEVVGFLGPNGAGKSTTLRILAGFLGATAGDVTVAGHSIATDPLKVRENVGYMPETAPLYPEMRVREYLHYRAELKGVKKPERAGAVERVLGDAGLQSMEGVLIGQLSKGYRQRVGIADALVASPPLLILDEPTAGLDPNQIREVRTLIGRLRDRHTIFLSTHILSEVEAVCTRAIVIARGELVAEGSIDELRRRRSAKGLSLRVRGKTADVLATLRAVVGVARVELEGEEPRGSRYLLHFQTEVESSDSITEAAARALVEAGHGILELFVHGSLEQVFAELTQAVAPKPAKPTPAPRSKRKDPS